jgi:hypothetical protein
MFVMMQILLLKKSLKNISQIKQEISEKYSFFLAKSMALVGDLLGNKAPINSLKLRKITDSLTFSNEK